VIGILGKRSSLPQQSAILESNESIDADKAKIKVRELNEIADGDLDLVTAMDTSKPGGLVAFGLIKGSKSLDYKDGNAGGDTVASTTQICP
jgi:hypothetical protein